MSPKNKGNDKGIGESQPNLKESQLPPHEHSDGGVEQIEYQQDFCSNHIAGRDSHVLNMSRKNQVQRNCMMSLNDLKGLYFGS